MRWPLALLGLLLLMPTVAAQLPTDDLCVLEANAAAPTPLAPGEVGVIVLTVENAGRSAMSVTGSLSITDLGWEYQADTRSAVTIQPGNSAALQFEIEPTSEATRDATANLVARGTCVGPGGTECPFDQCRVEQAASTTARLRPAEGLQIPGLSDLAFPVEYLIAALVLVGLVTAFLLLARRPKRGLRAECPEPLKMLRPGRGASFPIAIENPGPEATTAQLEVGAVPAGWSAFMPLPDVQLAARESRSMFLMVRAPAEAATGDAVEVEVVVRPHSRPQKPVIVRVRAEVQDAPATPDA